MKYIALLSLSLLLNAAPISEHTIPKKPLRELATSLGINESADLITETQRRWLRRPGQERWEMAELTPDNAETVVTWAKQHGMLDECAPCHQTYDVACILGATTGRMQKRLDYLIGLCERGFRFNQIVWLTGDRPLDGRVDRCTDRCATESEAARLIWEESALPEKMRRLPVSFIATPMKGVQRPTTRDTLVTWIASRTGPTSVLFISDQPFCGYQFAIVKRHMPDSYTYDIAGAGIAPSAYPRIAAVTLDSLARWLYAESTP